MESFRQQFIDPLVERLGEYLPNVLVALIVLIVGWFVVILIAKALFRIIKLTGVDDRIEESTGERYKFSKIIARFVYYLLLLFLFLLVLNIQGEEKALEPLRNMFTEFFTMLPNIIGALLIGFMGYLIGKIVAAGITLAIKPADSISSDIGLGKKISISKIVGQILFIVIFVPTLIAALDALEIEAISAPAIGMLNTFLEAIPTFLFAALILTVAYFIGRFVSSNVTLILKNLNVDQLPKKLGLEVFVGEKVSLSKFIGGLIFFFIIFAAFISASEKLNFTLISALLGKLVAFAAQIALGLIILAVGNFISRLAYKFLTRSESNKNITIATVVRFVILGLVFAIGLKAMGIADEIVHLAFGLSLGACAVAFALAFGLGGREAAGKQVEHWFKKLRGEE